MTTSSRTIGELTKSCLKLPQGEKVPKTLHDALNNILIKGNGKNTEFRTKVIRHAPSGGSRNHSFRVVDRHIAVIHNALCLFHLYGVGLTKQLFNLNCVAHQSIDVERLSQARTDNCFRFACVGVAELSLDRIESCLTNSDFNLLSEKLPSPFELNGHDISSMLNHYRQPIPWDEYWHEFNLAKQYWQDKNFELTHSTLQQLLDKSVVKLPVVQDFYESVTEQHKQALEGIEFLKKIYN